jgi:hypothetical protein
LVSDRIERLADQPGQNAVHADGTTVALAWRRRVSGDADRDGLEFSDAGGLCVPAHRFRMKMPHNRHEIYSLPCF